MEKGRLEGYSEEVLRGRDVKERCVRCSKETEYDVNTPITVRRYFVEGSGQLCEQCYFTLYPVRGSLQSNLGKENGSKDNPTIIPNKL